MQLKPQLPIEISAPITLYVRYKNISTGEVKPIRCVLQNCFQHDKAEEIRTNTGAQLSRASTVHIPHPRENTGRKYLTPEEWYTLSVYEAESGLYWSYDPKLVSTLPIYVPEAIDFEFEWGTESSVTIQENNFIASHRNAFRTIGMDNFVYGSHELRHHMLRS